MPQTRHKCGNRAHKHKLCILMAHKAGCKCRGQQLFAFASGLKLQRLLCHCHWLKIASAVLVLLLPLTLFPRPAHLRWLMLVRLASCCRQRRLYVRIM